MKAVILAAGLGSRLRPITNRVPKCMVPVNGICIIDKQIDNLIKAGVSDIIVVSGYKHEVLDSHIKEHFPFIQIVHNSRYDQTNNMYSLFLTSDYVRNEEFLLMNSDVYFDSDVISDLLAGRSSSKIACDRSQFLEESMKITLCENRINHISKAITEKEYYAVSIDVYLISAKDSETLFSEIKHTIVEDHDENSWTEVALDRIFDKCEFMPCVIKGRWFEIDNHNDLILAEKLFTGDKLTNK